MEFFRTPLTRIFSTLGAHCPSAQWLCVPMVVIGIMMMAHAKRKPAN